MVALAGLFAEVIGVDPDVDMLVEAAARAAEFGVENLRWVHLRAEALPAGLGHFRYATFAQSFHWMEREVVAEIMFRMIEPGGAFVHVNTAVPSSQPPAIPFPSPPRAAIDALIKSYLGEDHRAGQSVLRYGTPDGEARVLVGAGFRPARSVPVKGREALERSVGDIISWVLSHSNSAPHLFGATWYALKAIFGICSMTPPTRVASHSGLAMSHSTSTTGRQSGADSTNSLPGSIRRFGQAVPI